MSESKKFCAEAIEQGWSKCVDNPCESCVMRARHREAVEPMHASAEGIADAVMEMCRTLSEPRKSIVHLLVSWKASRPVRATKAAR